MYHNLYRSRIRSQARVISGGIRQLMVCSRILCRIRNAGSSDQDNRHRKQLRQDPLPEIGNQCGRIRSQARVISSRICQLMVCSGILCMDSERW